jgi:hypothetical protein
MFVLDFYDTYLRINPVSPTLSLLELRGQVWRKSLAGAVALYPKSNLMACLRLNGRRALDTLGVTPLK